MFEFTIGKLSDFNKIFVVSWSRKNQTFSIESQNIVYFSNVILVERRSQIQETEKHII